MIQIRNRYTGDVICEGETIREAVCASIKNLRGADLRGANLRDADLTCANLTGARLTGANLTGADFRCAHLFGVCFRGADLTNVDLTGSKLAWQSHDLLAEILRRAAGDDVTKLKVAGLILISRDKCWKDFLDMAEREPLAGWALDELAKWVQPDDGAPNVLRQRAAANEAVLGGKL